MIIHPQPRRNGAREAAPLRGRLAGPALPPSLPPSWRQERAAGRWGGLGEVVVGPGGVLGCWRLRHMGRMQGGHQIVLSPTLADLVKEGIV